MDARRIAFAILWCGAGSATVASASPLHEIGHTAITDVVCANVVVHANSAIAASLRDDDALGRALARLRSANFDDDSPGRRTAVIDLGRIAAEIGDGATHGVGETRRLTALASDAPADHAAELRTFAASLGSALDRQGKISSELGGFVASLENRDLRGSASTETGDAAVRMTGRSLATTPPRLTFGGPPSPTSAARGLANEIERLLVDIARDEARAADRAEIAVTGC